MAWESVNARMALNTAGNLSKVSFMAKETRNTRTGSTSRVSSSMGISMARARRYSRKLIRGVIMRGCSVWGISTGKGSYAV